MRYEDGAGRLRGAAFPAARFPLSLADAYGRRGPGLEREGYGAVSGALFPGACQDT